MRHRACASDVRLMYSGIVCNEIIVAFARHYVYLFLLKAFLSRDFTDRLSSEGRRTRLRSILACKYFALIFLLIYKYKTGITMLRVEHTIIIVSVHASQIVGVNIVR